MYKCYFKGSQIILTVVSQHNLSLSLCLNTLVHVSEFNIPDSYVLSPPRLVLDCFIGCDDLHPNSIYIKKHAIRQGAAK